MLPQLLTRLLSIIVGILWASSAWAIELDVPCATPSVFANAPLNVVVLPYSQPVSLGPTRTRAGEQLGGLVQLETLLAIAKFGGIGITQLVGQPREGCTPEIVLDKLLGRQPGARERLKQGGALILIWGRIFESGSNLFLQSYIRFLRAGVNETIDLTVRDRPLTGSLSTQAFACAPRRIAIDEIDDVLRQFASARLLHERPDVGSAVVKLPQGGGPYAYAITAIQGDWVQLQPLESRPGGNRPLNRGWMLARATEAQWSLRRRMPELFFVEGVAGYLAFRVQPKAPQAANWLANADTAINRYLDAWGANAVMGSDAAAGGTPLAVAVPRQLRAFVSLFRANASNAALTEALPQFERAASLVPHSSDARNLVTMIRMARAYGPSAVAPEQPRQFIDELRALLGTDPDNDALLRNLTAAYDLVLANPAVIPEPERQRLTRERNALATVRKG